MAVFLLIILTLVGVWFGRHCSTYVIERRRGELNDYQIDFRLVKQAHELAEQRKRQGGSSGAS